LQQKLQKEKIEKKNQLLKKDAQFNYNRNMFNVGNVKQNPQPSPPNK